MLILRNVKNIVILIRRDIIIILYKNERKFTIKVTKSEFIIK